MKRLNIGVVILGAAMIGCLMAFRHEIGNVWGRALLAALAGLCFAGTLAWINRHRTAN